MVDHNVPEYNPPAQDPAEGRRPDVGAVLSRLKDFQRTTVDYVHHRLWHPDDPARRFLVADEVGLGKTLVARGVIVRTIDELWDSTDQITIVYLCSNGQIARQNMSRLTVPGVQPVNADRLTMIPMHIGELHRKRVSMLAFTPGTSFNVSVGSGRAGERALLFVMLEQAWGRAALRATRWLHFFRSTSGIDSFRWQVNQTRKNHAHRIDPGSVQAFSDALATTTGPGGDWLQSELLACAEEFRGLQHPDRDLSRRRNRLIGALRSAVAKAAVQRLSPNLVIMDEFQRFSDLLDHDEDNSAAELAHALFDHTGPDGTAARTLMLSATPYKMLTLTEETDAGDHYEDFTRTVRFLGGQPVADRVQDSLAAIRSGLRSRCNGVPGAALQGRANLERELRRVMCRTERLAATADRDGMLTEVPSNGMALTADDVRGLSTLGALADHSGGPSNALFEFWRSAPYPLNLMDRSSYVVKRALDERLEHDPQALLEPLRQARGLLDWQTINRYRVLDPGNIKMRALMSDVLDSGAWKVAWLPPSLPYYSLGSVFANPGLRRFTKRLLFSAWAVAPKSIAVVLSYEAERRANQDAGDFRAEYTSRAPTPPLQYRTSEGRRAAMPVLAMGYPSPTLATLGDPLQVARELRTVPASSSAVRQAVGRRVATALQDLPPGDPSMHLGSDQRWYWAAPFLLDARADGEGHAAFLTEFDRWARQVDRSDDHPRGQPHIAGHRTSFQDHVAEARDLDPAELGARPDDLVEVLTSMAIAGPGVSALRALGRVAGGPAQYAAGWLRNAALPVARGLRSMFNQPEIQAVVRASADLQLPYWRQVLGHAEDGCLQAVLDEYVHVLVESEGLADAAAQERAEKVAEVVEEGMSLRTRSNRLDHLWVAGGQVHHEAHTARTHFAARLADGRSEDEASQVSAGHIRVAFNSPFWPFVLATTSVGQEGLDFHTYAHAVVHWNLPGNPVDLEQREGRVHQYKGHAVRKNVAAVHGLEALEGEDADPWAAMFEAASAVRAPGTSDLVPYWIFTAPDGATIERHVPTIPLSTEVVRYRRLQRTMGAYRLAFGQPRQEDLLELIGDNAGALEALRVDLSPPEVSRPWGPRR